MHEESGTVAMLLVAWLQDVLSALESGEIRVEDYDLSSWRLMLLGTQFVTPNFVHRWKERFPHMLYDVNYGRTEASGPGCIHLVVCRQKKGCDYLLGKKIYIRQK